MKKFAIRGQHYCQRALTSARNASPRTVVFLRHGESQWNKEKRFSGWSDIPLTETGIGQARRAGKILRREGFEFDLAFTSYLTRTIQTFNHAAQEMDALHLPLIKSWKLNERHYGALQGLSKTKAVKQHGKETVQRWRRDYDYPPPSVDLFDKRHPAHERKYKGIPSQDLPTGESLKQTMRRVVPYWQQEIMPEVEAGKTVLVVAHENSLRGIIKMLDRISDQAVTQLEIPTGIPLVYEFDNNMEKAGHYYLAQEDDLEQQMAKVKRQIQQ